MNASFARYESPVRAMNPSDEGGSESVTEDSSTGARLLSHEELRALSSEIVSEVKSRGPFISVADFVNRRLHSRADDSNQAGVIEAAITSAANYNDGYESEDKFLKESGIRDDSNHSIFKATYLSSGDSNAPNAKAYGLPGYLMQSDLLEPLASSLTVRGDSFLIRTYGESLKNNQVVGRAWLEAEGQRKPDYVQELFIGVEASSEGNPASDSASGQHPVSGILEEGQLTLSNRQFGRRFKVTTIRWLNESEI